METIAYTYDNSKVSISLMPEVSINKFKIPKRSMLKSIIEFVCGYDWSEYFIYIPNDTIRKVEEKFRREARQRLEKQILLGNMRLERDHKDGYLVIDEIINSNLSKEYLEERRKEKKDNTNKWFNKIYGGKKK